MRAWRARWAARVVAGSFFLVALAAAGADAPPPKLSDIALGSGAGRTVHLQEVVRSHRLTVVVFFSSTCPCFAVHTERLRDLARELGPKGVELVVVDSERHAAGETRLDEVPGTELPILRDDGAQLARRLDAQYATESFVFDPSGQLRYRGGIDDQRRYLGPNPKAHLRESLLRLLGNDAPAFATAKALGCALRLM